MKKLSPVLLSPLLLFSCTRSVQEPAPNLVLILVDDLGWADVACNHPGTFHETPNIDRMAREGIRFTNGYAAHPVCSPTRAALLTGRHPNRIGITDWLPGDDPKDRPLIGPADRSEMALEEVTLAEKLKEKGYATAFVGKWHLGHEEKFWPEFQGFDINIGGWSAGQPFIRPGISNGYFSPYGNPRLTDGPEGEYLTDRLTTESLRFMDQHRDKPFLLYLSYYTVHTPIQAAEKHIARFSGKREQLYGDQEIPHAREGEGYTKLVQESAEYASMVAALDENVGRIMDGLREMGLDRNTWVVFTSDNGGLSTLRRLNAPTSNEPLRAGKGWCYEGGIRVPMIIAGPGISKPGVSDQPVVSMDIFPTFLELAGIDYGKVDGVSLLPLLRSGKKNGGAQGTKPDQSAAVESLGREVIFWHYPHYHGSGWKPGSALRAGKWKVIVHYEEGITELYNLEEDPRERNDLSESMPEKTTEMKLLLDRKLAETGALFPVPNPDL